MNFRPLIRKWHFRAVHNAHAAKIELDAMIATEKIAMGLEADVSYITKTLRYQQTELRWRWWEMWAQITQQLQGDN